MGGCDVAVVGSGPNGLAAGVLLARAGLSVRLYEAAPEFGGGLRSSALFDSEVVHDHCATVHPMTCSRFFREFDLPARGVPLRSPRVSYAHPLDDGRGGLAHRELARTCERLGADGARWRRLMGPLVERSTQVTDLLLGDLRHPPRELVTPVLLGLRALAHGTRQRFPGQEAAAMLTGVAAHSIEPLPSLPGAAVALLLGHLAHATGWPLAEGGSARIAEAMVADLRAHGAELHPGTPVTNLRELREAKAVLLDVAPRGFARIAGAVLPERYRGQLEAFHYGPGVAKLDLLVSERIPWRNPQVSEAATVHLGGTHEEIAAYENAVAAGRSADRPFVLLVDPAAADPGRARPGKYPVWAYCHVPNGDPRDYGDAIAAQIERFAPGFGETVLARRSLSATAMEKYNPNYVGGNIGVGTLGISQVFLRPTPRLNPYRTPLHGVYLCSAATPPGPSVHGMAGYFAARTVLRREFGIRELPGLAPTTPATTSPPPPPPGALS